MQIVRSATSISWIPSDSIPGLLSLLMDKGLMHYDPPPPLTVTDLESMRRKGEFRFANVLRAWIEVEDGKIRDYRYAGGVVMGLTPVTVGGLRVLLPTKGNPEIRHSPQVERALSEQIMQRGERPGVRTLRAGEFLFRQAEEGTSMAVILDGNFEVRVDGRVVGHVGPGTVVGERASLEGGRRTADLRAVTNARVADAAPGTLSAEQLSELAFGHHREDAADT